MDFYNMLIILICIINIHIFTTFASKSPEDNPLQTYIVHVESPEPQIFTNSDDLHNWYHSFLPPNPASSSEEPRIIYSYRSVLKGFAAKLSPEDVKEMEKKDGFLFASPDERYSLHTTHTPNFLGLFQNSGFWKDSNFGKGVIIGVLDTGIFPDHPSFSDVGMPPPPPKWKGKCEFNFTACNNKLIGAKSFLKPSIFIESKTPLDENGHGTHTASTAGGSFVKGANVFGLGNGTAVGMAPLAHLAIYKVCDKGGGCLGSDVLAGMDAAIEDGVDVMSLSLGFSSTAFYAENIAIGAYSAMEKGIFVSCSAGNRGPSNQSLSNEAPWILTVGASTIDRKLKATAMLGNKELFDGHSPFQPQDFPSTMFPLIYSGQNKIDFSAGSCSRSSLNNSDIRGKIVLCDISGGVSGIQSLKDAGVAAIIFMNSQLTGFTTFESSYALPAITLSFQDGEKIIAYINSTLNSTKTTPTVSITYKGTIIGDVHAPAVASFSSRGPSRASPGILKPDIIGPGVNILAAWPLSVENKTNTKANFNIISGTSMSCPHLSGIAALLKSAHPDWSPSIIKSAIMTTADQVNLGNQPFEDEWKLQQANIFAIGAGHVNPSKANNPGLVYDIQPQDYIPYLCGLNYTNRQVAVILQRKVNCSEELTIQEAQLNYPSFSIKMESMDPQTYTRTLTNVGDPVSTYAVEIVPPPGVDVRVEPPTLVFTELNQKLNYQVTFTPLKAVELDSTFSQGYLKWTSANYSVRSPIAIIFRLFL